MSFVNLNITDYLLSTSSINAIEQQYHRSAYSMPDWLILVVFVVVIISIFFERPKKHHTYDEQVASDIWKRSKISGVDDSQSLIHATIIKENRKQCRKWLILMIVCLPLIQIVHYAILKWCVLSDIFFSAANLVDIAFKCLSVGAYSFFVKHYNSSRRAYRYAAGIDRNAYLVGILNGLLYILVFVYLVIAAVTAKGIFGF